MNRLTRVRLPVLQDARAYVAKAPNQRMFRAGGIDLMDHLKEGLIDAGLRTEAPLELVELRAVEQAEPATQMYGVSQLKDGSWRIGAGVTLAQLGAFELPSSYAAAGQAANSAATPSIRNAATVGGNLLQRPRCWYYRHRDFVCLKKGGTRCFAQAGENRYHAILGGGPSFAVHASSLAAAFVALDARVSILGADGLRTVELERLFVPPSVDPTREHALEPGEVVVGLELPAAQPKQSSVYLAAKEKLSHDWPLAEASVRGTLSGQGQLTKVRVALGHVAPTPWRSREAEAVLEGQPASAELFAEAAAAALAPARPLAHNKYKVRLAANLLRDALHKLTRTPFPE